MNNAWKVSEYWGFSGPYFPVFGPEKTPYLDTFHAVQSKFKHTYEIGNGWKDRKQAKWLIFIVVHQVSVENKFSWIS